MKSNEYIELASDDRVLWVRLNKQALQKGIDCCRATGSLETGGILVGYYSKNKTTCTIVELVQPSDDSVHKPFTFTSGVKGLKGLLKNFWLQKRYFVGDWHFHPKNSPKPSRQDLKQLKLISENPEFECAKPIMLIIGQNKKKFIISCTLYLNNEYLTFTQTDSSEF